MNRRHFLKHSAVSTLALSAWPGRAADPGGAKKRVDLGWPKRVSSSGGIYVDKKSRTDISDTQTATFEFPELNVVWTHEQGYISTTACILANLSMQLGRSLEWDPAAGRVVNDDPANGLLRRP